MSNKNAKNAVNAPDVHVVAPSNMGKGLVWNDKTKQYEVTGGLTVSPDAGNQIEQRNNGIYYGTVAPDEVRDLYVSSVSGNDSNPGTREAPLRTIQAAVDKLKDTPVRYTIWLHKSETFEWVHKDLQYPTITFSVYGAETTHPFSVPANAYYRGHLAMSFPRPVVKIQVKEKQGFMMRHYLTAQNLTFLGIKFEINNTAINDNFTLPGHFAGFVNTITGKTEFEGCVINVTGRATHGSGAGLYRNDSLTRCKTISFLHCHTDTGMQPYPDGTTLAYTYIGPTIQYSRSNGDGILQGYGQAPDYQVYATLDFVSKLNLRNIAYDFAYDQATKSLFGITVNFDIFRNA